MPLRFLSMVALAAFLPCAGIAQSLPADCSAAAAPKGPLSVSVGGVKFTPKAVTLRRAGGMTTGGEQFDAYNLTMLSEPNTLMAPLEADVTVIVLKGQSIEGRVFRRLATKNRDKQPSASKQQVELEVQGWSFKNRPEKAGSSHAEYLASLRLEFGKRQGDTISGSIYLCSTKGQTSIFNKKPTREDSYAVGAFQARLEK